MALNSPRRYVDTWMVIDAPVAIRPAARATGTSRHTLVKVLRGTAAGTVGTYAINLLLLPFILGRLGRDLYGAWATIATILAIGGLADIGIRTEIVRRVAAANGDDNEAALAQAVHEGLTLLVALASVLLLVGMVAAPAIRTFAFPHGVSGDGGATIDPLVRAVFGLLAVSLVGNGYFAVLPGVQRGDVVTVSGAVAVTVGAAVTVAGLVLGWGIWSLLIASAVELAVLLVWQWIALGRLLPRLRPRLVRMSPARARSYLALSSLIFVFQLGDVFDFQWDKFMLARFVGAGAVSSFQIGGSLVMGARVLAQLPLTPLLTAASELRRRDPQRMDALFDLLTKVGMLVTAVVVGGVFVFAPAFIGLWLGPDMQAAGQAARLLAVAVAITIIGAPQAFRALAEGWHALAAKSAVTNVVVNGALSAFLTVSIGFNGPLYGSIVGSFAGLFTLMFLLRRRLGPQFRMPPWRALAGGACCAALAVGSGVDAPSSWPGLAVAASLYAVTVAAICGGVERIPLSALRPRFGPVAAE